MSTTNGTTIQSGPVADESIGQTLGRYKLLEKIGEGGFGVVYVAEQKEPVKRRVALKIIKLGMDTRQVVARFEAERQALALMDHPNIAKVLDAGATDSGRPYFVMELVRGVKVTEYCDQNKLSTKQRLELFIPVCQAIQHAHQKGIIHRDIKPSNILVTLHDGVPVPKVIDFGIAKATQQDLTDKTVYTQLQQFIGTPAYMSPEQAEMSGLDVDTRSDIYSLGVLLYELLTGNTPFDTKELVESGVDGMRKIIREREPVRPSTRLTQLRGQGKSQISNLRFEIPSDLDWIVMKCLEKDRTRRYETANGLASDLKRHFNNEPVLARPPSSAYRLQKLVRRNQLAVAAAGAVATALLLGVVASTWQAVRATHAKQQAQAAQASETAQRKLADAARANETVLRERAQSEELIARQRAYASDMNVAKLALDGYNLGRALELLNRQRPQPGQKDLRGWEWRYLWQQTRSDALFSLCHQSNEIESLASSADGRWLAIGLEHNDGLVVYDLRTRQQVAHLVPGHSFLRAAFSPTEPLLAFTSWTTNTLHLWNAATRQTVAELPTDGTCIGLAFSSDGKILAASTRHGSISRWRVTDATQLTSYATPDQTGVSPGTPFAATADLTLAAYACNPTPQRVRVADLRHGKELWSAPASAQYITALAFSPDGQTLATAGGFGESDIRLWDVATGKETAKLEGHGSFVSSILFWPDGKKMASSSADQTIRIWDLKNQECLDVLRGHQLEVWRLTLLPDNKTLISGSKDGAVNVWGTSVTHQKQARFTLPGRIVGWCFSPDSRSVRALDIEGRVTQWSGTEFQQRETLLDLSTNIISGRWENLFSRDGRFLAFGYDNGITQVWDVSRKGLMRQWTNTTGRVEPLAFLAGGHKLLTRSMDDRAIHEWDLITAQETQAWPSVFEDVLVLGSPGGERFMEFGSSGELRCRNLANAQITETNLDFLEMNGAAYSPGNELLAVSSGLGYARVWNTTTWREIDTLRGYLLGLASVAFSPDGRRLATGSDNREALKLWDTESWRDVLTLEGQGADFSKTAFSPDGNLVGSLSLTGTMHLWRAPSWDEINATEAKDKAASKEP